MKFWETFKDCLQDTITTAIYLSQLMGCMEFSTTFIDILQNPFVAINKYAIARCEQPFKQ